MRTGFDGLNRRMEQWSQVIGNTKKQKFHGALLLKRKNWLPLR
jgi:hypothetical protein